MKLCAYNENYIIRCTNQCLIPQLTIDQVKNLSIMEPIGEGFFGKVYFGLMGDYSVAIKVIDSIENEPLKIYENEICNQQKVSEYHLAPQVLGYWTCDTEWIIVMDFINGLRFHDIIFDQPDRIPDLFCEMIRQIVFKIKRWGLFTVMCIHLILSYPIVEFYLLIMVLQKYIQGTNCY